MSLKSGRRRVFKCPKGHKFETIDGIPMSCAVCGNIDIKLVSVSRAFHFLNDEQISNIPLGPPHLIAEAEKKKNKVSRTQNEKVEKIPDITEFKMTTQQFEIFKVGFFAGFHADRRNKEKDLEFWKGVFLGETK